MSSPSDFLFPYNVAVVAFDLCWKIHQLITKFRPKKHAFHEVQTEVEAAASASSDEGQDGRSETDLDKSGGKGDNTIKVNQIV